MIRITEEEALELVFNTLYRKTCKCGGDYRQRMDRKIYQCCRCARQIAPRANTIFAKSDTPLILWFQAVHLIDRYKGKLAITELQRQLGVTYKTAFRMKHLIYEAFGDMIISDNKLIKNILCLNQTR